MNERGLTGHRHQAALCGRHRAELVPETWSVAMARCRALTVVVALSGAGSLP